MKIHGNVRSTQAGEISSTPARDIKQSNRQSDDASGSVSGWSSKDSFDSSSTTVNGAATIGGSDAATVSGQELHDAFYDDSVKKTQVDEDALRGKALSMYKNEIVGQSDDESITAFQVKDQTFYAISQNNGGNGTTYFANASGKIVSEDGFTEG